MNFNQKETYIIFRTLLYVQLRLTGLETLIEKIVKEYPEWQRVIDRKIKSDAEVEAFRKRILG